MMRCVTWVMEAGGVGKDEVVMQPSKQLVNS
jgi:hypothetical protein